MILYRRVPVRLTFLTQGWSLLASPKWLGLTPWLARWLSTRRLWTLFGAKTTHKLRVKPLFVSGILCVFTLPLSQFFWIPVQNSGLLSPISAVQHQIRAALTVLFHSCTFQLNAADNTAVASYRCIQSHLLKRRPNWLNPQVQRSFFDARGLKMI